MDRWHEREQRALVRAGTIAAAIYNVNRDPKKHPKGFTARDIFDLPAPPRGRRTTADLIKRAESFFGAHNAAVAHQGARRKGGVSSLPK